MADSPHRRLPVRSLLAAAALAFAPSAAHAATYQWDVNGTTAGLGGTGTWNTTNTFWDDLASGSNAGADSTSSLTLSQSANLFQFGGTAGTVSLSGNTSVGGITFNTDGYIIDTKPSTTSYALTIGSSGITANNSATLATSNSAGGSVVLGAAQSWTVASTKTLTVNTAITSGGFVLTLNGAGTTALAGIMSGTGGITMNNASGVLTSTVAHTYTGTTTLTAGTIRIGNNGGLGGATAKLALNGGSVMSNSTSSYTVTAAGNSTIGGDITFGASSTYTGALTFGNAFDFGGATRTLTVSSSVASALVFNGALSNGSLVKTGGGEMVLGGTNSLSAITVNAGTLVTGSAGVGNTLTQLTLGASGKLNFTGTSLTNNAGTALQVTGAGTFVVDNASANIAITDISTSALAGLSTSVGSLFVRQGSVTLSGTGINLSVIKSGDNRTGQTTSTTAAIYIGSGATSINTSNLQVGTNTTAASTLGFATGATSAVLTLRGTGGGSARVSSMTVGQRSTSYLTTISGTADFTGGTLDAMVTSLDVGLVSYSATGVYSQGTLKMGAGTLDVTTLRLGVYANTQPSSTTLVEGVLTQSDGLVKAQTIKLVDATSANATTATLTGTYNLNAGTLRASSIIVGASAVGSWVRTLNLAGGTLANYDASNDLTVGAGIDVVLGSTSAVQADSGRTVTINSAVSGLGGLTKTGNGTLVLGGANTYTGVTRVNAGAVSVASAGSLASNAIVDVAGGSFGFAAGSTQEWGSGRVLRIGGAGVVGAGTVANSFKLSGGSIGFDLTDAASYDVLTIASGGTLDLTAGTFAFNLTAGTIATGTYNFVNYTGATLAGSLANITKTGLASGNSRQTFSFSDTGSALQLNVAGAAAAVTWTGSAGSTWGSGSLSDANWTTTDAVDDTTHFYDGDSVTFSGAGAGTVTLGSAISAGAVAVSGSSDYTFAGAALSASSIAKSGSGKLTLSNAATASGGTSVSGGVLELVAGGSLGGATTVASGGTLLLSGGTVDSATLSGGVIEYTGNGVLTGLTSLTVGSGNGTLRFSAVGATVSDAANRILANSLAVEVADAGTTATLGGTLSGTGATLNKTGAGALVLTGTNTYTGTTTLTAGALRAGAAAAFGTSTLALNGGALTSDSTTARSLSNAVTVGGDVTLGDATLNGVLTLSGTVNLGAATRTLTMASDTVMSGVVSNGTLTKAGAGMLTLSATNTYAGGTNVNAGNLRVGVGTAAGSITGAVTVASGATLSFYRNDSGYTVANALSGSGTVSLVGTGTQGQSSYTPTATNTSFDGQWSIGSGARANLAAQGNVGSSSATVNVASGGQAFLSGASAYTSNFTIAGNGWNETSGYLGAIRLVASSSISGNITLSGNAVIGIHGPASGTSAATLSGSIGETGGARTLELKNTNTTGTSTFNLNGATSLTGGFLVGTPGTGLTVVNLTSTGTMTFGSGATVAVGNNAGAGTLYQNLNIAGAVTNSGALALRRVGQLNINSGGTWAQSGALGVTASGGYSSYLYVNAGGSLTYTGNSTIKVDAAAGNNGEAWVTVDSTGVLTTSAGFERTTVQGAGAGVGKLSLTNGGTLKLGANVAELLVGEAVMTISGGANINTNGYGTTVSKVISGSGGLTKTGNGTLTLNAAHTYTGTTTVSGGTLALGASGSMASTTVNVTNGGALADFTWSGGKTLQIGGAGTLGNGGVGGSFSLAGGTIGFDVTDASAYDYLTVATGGTLALTSGTLAFNLTSGQLLAGDYDFIRYAGGSVTGDWSAFGKTGLPAGGTRQSVTFLDTGSALRMSVVGAVSSVTWTGAVSGAWASGASADANWSANEVVDDATHYYEKDAVTFGDTGAGTLVVDGAGVSPGAVTVNATAGYTFTGGAVSATSLAKSGNGTLTLGNAVSTVAGTTVSGGTLAFAAGGSLSGGLTVSGSGASVNLGTLSVSPGAVVLADGSITNGTLSATSLDLRKGTVSAVVAGAGNVTKSTADTVVLSAANTYTGTTTINAGTLEFSSGSNQTLTGNLLGSGGTLKKSGAGTLTLTPTADSTFAGDINVTGGSLTIGANFKATGTGALTLGTGTTLNTFGISGASSGTTAFGNTSITLNGASFNFGGSSSSTVTHTYNFASLTAPISVTDSSLNFSSTNSTTKVLNAALSFSGSNVISYSSSNYTHTLNLNGAITGSGTLTFNTSGTSTGGKTITVASGLANNFTGAVVLNSSNSSGVMSTLKLSSALGATSYEIKNAYWTLQNNVAGGLNSANGITISAGTLELTQAWSNTAATLSMSGGAVNVGNAASSIGRLTGTAGTIQGTGASSSLTVNQSTDGTFAGVLATNGSSNLAFTKNGAGTLTLSGTNTTTGLVTVGAGALSLTGSLAGGVNAAAGTTLSGSGSVAGALALGAGSTLTGTVSIAGTVTAASGSILTPGVSGVGALSLGGLTFSNLATVNLVASATAPIGITGALTTSGAANSVTLNIAGAAPAVGTYTLLDYGSLAGTGFSAFKLGALPNRVIASLVNNTANTSVDLDVTGVDFPVWRGDISTEWSTNALASGSTGNWVLNSDTGVATDFLATDTVQFDDTATVTTVDISQGNVAPAAAIFNNSSKDYVLTGTNGISGTASLTKRGNGKLTLAAANSYSGATTIEAGTVSVAAVAADGTASGLGSSGTVTLNGGTLEFTGITGTTNRAFAVGSSNGTLSVSASNGSLTLSTAITGAGALTKAGNGTLVLSAANTNGGGVAVTAGTLQVGAGGSTGSFAGAGSVSSGAKLAFRRNGTSAITVANALSGAGTVEFWGSGVKDESAYTVSGTNTSFSGTWSVLSGARLLAGAASALGSGAVNVQSGGGLYLSASGTYANALTISGSGWNETAGYLGAVRVSGGTLSGNITLAGSAAIGANVSSGTTTTTLSGSIGESGGARTLEIKNTVSGGTAAFTLSGATNLSGGITIGATNTGATTVTVGSTGTVTLTGGTLRVGNTAAAGTTTQTLSVTGAVTNAGALYLGRASVLNVNSGGSVSQSGAASVNSQGGYAAALNVNSGGTFTYSGNSTFKLNPGSASDAGIAIAGGTFVTSQGFEQGAAGGVGYVSKLTISAGGTLRLAANVSALATGLSVVTSGTGGKIDTNGYDGTLSVGVTGSGTAGLTKQGNGTLALTGASTYAGNTFVTGGTLVLSGGENRLATGSAITITSGGLLDIASTNAIRRQSAANGSITIDGTGALTLSGGAEGAHLANLTLSNGGTLRTESSASSYAGWNFNLNGDVLVTGLGASAIGVKDGLGLNGTRTFTVDDTTLDAAADLVVTGAVVDSDTNAGTLVKAGAGKLSLASANGFTGGLMVNAGTVAVAGGSALGGSGVAAADRILLNGGALQATATFATDANHGLTLGASGGTISVDSGATMTLTAGLSGAGALTKSGNGTLLLASAGTFSGATAINAGTLVLGNSSALGTSIITVNTGATLDFANLAAANVVYVGGGTLLNYGSWTGAIGVASGASLGAAELNALPGSSVYVASGATVDLSGLTKGVVYSGGSLVGLSGYTGDLVVQGALDLSTVMPQGSIEIRAGGQIDLGGRVTDKAITYAGGTLLGTTGYSGTVTVSGQGVSLAAGGLGTGAILVGSGNSAILGAGLTNAVQLSNGGAIQAASLSGYAGTLTIGTGSTVNLGKAEAGTAVNAPAASIVVGPGGTLAGEGSLAQLTVAAGGELAPGNSPGLITVVGTTTLQAGGKMTFQLLNTVGTLGPAVPGVQYDSVTTDVLDLTGLSPSARFLLTLVSLSEANTQGIVADFNPLQDYSFTLFSYGTLNLSQGQNVSRLFAFDTKGFVDDLGKQVAAGHFSVLDDGVSLQLVYTAAIPEPSTYGLVLGAAALAAAAVRRRRARPVA